MTTDKMTNDKMTELNTTHPAITQEALAHLESAISHGFGDRLSMANDPDLVLVRKTPWFQAIEHAMYEKREV